MYNINKMYNLKKTVRHGRLDLDGDVFEDFLGKRQAHGGVVGGSDTGGGGGGGGASGEDDGGGVDQGGRFNGQHGT